MQEPRPAHIKGAAVQDFYAWCQQSLGPARMAEIWASLPSDAVAELGPAPTKLLAFRWYRASTIHALLDATLAGQSELERQRLAREGARVIANQTLRGLYRAIFSALVSPARYLKSANLNFKAFHDTGHATGVALGPGHHRVELEGWRGHHPFIEAMAGFFYEEVYRLMGCSDVTFKQSRGVDARGQPTYIADIRWKA
jgi:hypothetical protein